MDNHLRARSVSRSDVDSCDASITSATASRQWGRNDIGTEDITVKGTCNT